MNDRLFTATEKQHIYINTEIKLANAQLKLKSRMQKFHVSVIFIFYVGFLKPLDFNYCGNSGKHI